MAVLDKVYDKIKQLQDSGNYPDGITAHEAAIHIGVKRSTASLYLNELAGQGRLEKYDAHPVRFSVPGHRSAKDTPSSVLDSIIGAAQSLKPAIDLCKSAVIYPPNGLPLLIHGNSGTGKSFLAYKVYEYASGQGAILGDAKYVELNCADYASNPQLLSSVLFGYVKGAFTGASDTKSGLVAQADGGYLFLDEVHRLSFESQEKLFLLMDQGRYRMLGENSGWHKAKIRFIFATTESPGNVLLKTLLRRIPVQVTLPDWNKRPLLERLQFIYMTYHMEAEKLGRNFYLPAESVNYLLQYQSDGNIGSIRNKILISCAQVYKRTADSQMLTITFPTSLEALNKTIKPRLSDFVPSLNICRNDKSNVLPRIPLLFETEVHNLVERLEEDGYEAVKPEAYQLLKKIRGAATECFPKYDSPEQANPQICYYSRLIHNILHNMAFPLKDGKARFTKEFLMLFLFDVFDGFTLSEHEESILANSVEAFHWRMGHITDRILTLMQEAMPSSYSYIRFFLPLLLENALPNAPVIPAVIVSCGDTVASGIAHTVNKLCKNYIFDGLDIAVENGGVVEMVEKLRRYISRVDTSGGLLLLAAHDSPDEIYDQIKNYLQGELVIVGSVSTNLALNLGRILYTGCSFNDMAAYVEKLTVCQMRHYEKTSARNRMIVSCISGVGIARMIADIFRRRIKDSTLKIDTLDYEALTKMLQEESPGAFRDTRIVITINDVLSDDIAILPVYELQSKKGTALLKHQLGDYIDEKAIHHIVRDIGMLFSVEGIAASLRFLDPRKIVKDVSDCIEAYEMRYGIHFSGSTRMNLFLHISLMVERLMLHSPQKDRQASIPPSTELSAFIENSAAILAALIEKYNISIMDDELEMIYEIVKYELTSESK